MKYSQFGITITTYLDNRKASKDGLYPIQFIVRHKRKQIFLPVGIRLTPEEWQSLEKTRTSVLIKKRDQINSRFIFIQNLVEKLVNNGRFSLEDLAFNYKNIIRSNNPNKSLDNITSKKILEKSINERFKEKIVILETSGSIGYAEIHKTSLNKLSQFNGLKPMKFEDITMSWLKRFEEYMVENGCSYTTIGIYLRPLRTIFNDAISDGYINSKDYPFGKRKYMIPTGSRRNLALQVADIKKIFEYKTDLTNLQKSKDLWVLSYLCNGANFNDILRWQFKNIKNDEIKFIRKKTVKTVVEKKAIVIYLTPAIKEILDKYKNSKNNPDDYIFPYLSEAKDEKEKKKIIKNVIRLTNDHMKIICNELNIPYASTYVARHTFASVLKRSGVNKAFIQEALGHENIKTTENYLASFETEERIKNAKLLTNFEN